MSARENRQILGAIAPGDLEQEQGLHRLAGGQAALAGLELEVGVGQNGHPEAAQGAGGGQKAGVGRAHLLEGFGVQMEGRFGLEWQACWHMQNNRPYIYNICKQKMRSDIIFFTF